ncbi:hypothetical protein [Acetobacterium bakii]|nr:hypothetical protein [Acetobacterium bakii]
MKTAGYQLASLAVLKDNHALKLNLAVGFMVIDKLEQEYLMICELA